MPFVMKSVWRHSVLSKNGALRTRLTVAPLRRVERTSGDLWRQRCDSQGGRGGRSQLELINLIWVGLMAGVLTPPPTLPPPRPFSFSEAIPLSCSLSMWRECLSSRASRVKPAPSGMIPRQRRPPGTSDSKPVCLWTALTRRWLQPPPLITAPPPHKTALFLCRCPPRSGRPTKTQT